MFTLLLALPLAASLACAQPIHHTTSSTSRQAPPISPISTLSSISCLPNPPYMADWRVLTDPYACLRLCGAAADSDSDSDIESGVADDFSAVLRPRKNLTHVGPAMDTGDHDDPYEIPLSAGQREFDCICLPGVEVAGLAKSGPFGCDENAWFVYTPIRKADGDEVEVAFDPLDGFVVQL